MQNIVSSIKPIEGDTDLSGDIVRKQDETG